MGRKSDSYTPQVETEVGPTNVEDGRDLKCNASTYKYLT